MTSSPVRLVINADDLGFAPGVNRGIFEAHAAGTVSSASMIVTAPAFAEAAEHARRDAPRLGVGLHLNLVTGAPLSSVPSLVDPATGQFSVAGGRLNDAWHFMSETKLRDGSVLLAGGYPNDPGATAQAWIYRP